MLRFSRAKVIVTIGVDPDRPHARSSEPDDAASSGRRFRTPCRAWSRPGSCRRGRSCSASIFRAVRTSSSRSTSRTSCARRRPSFATTCGASCARPASSLQGGIQLTAARRPGARAGRRRSGIASCRSCASSSQPIGNAILGQTGAHDLQITDSPDGADPAHLYGRRRSTRRSAGPSTRRSRSCAGASTRSARPSPTSSARAPTASSSRCRACRTRSV